MRTRNSNKRSSLRAASPESEESPEKMKRESRIQKDGGENTKSIKNGRPSLRAVSAADDELPLKRVSPRQKGRRKTKLIKNDSVIFSDKGYCGSSSEEDSDWHKEARKVADSGVISSKKRKSEAAPDESSDSSSDDFLVPTQSIDLNSDFFKIEKKEPVSDFSAIENSIFAGINRLSESEDSVDLQDMKPVEVERVESKAGLEKENETVKDEHSSAESVTIKVEDTSDIKPLAVRKGKKTHNAIRQKTSDKNSRQQKSLQDKAVIKSKHFKVEKEVRLQKDKKQAVARKQIHKVEEEIATPDVSKLDVSQLLALGEGLDCKPKPATETKRRNVSKKNVESEEEGMSDWEEVDTGTFEGQQIKHTIPKEGITVTVQVPNIHQKKKKKKGFDMAAYVKRRMNSVRRDIQVLMHKAHLLCWIAHGNYVNKILNSEILMGLSLSLIPSKHCYPDKHTDLAYLQQVVQWFSKAVEVQENVDVNEDLLVSLQAQFQKKAAKSRRDMVLLFVCVLRSLGINTRLVISLQPVPLKPPLSEISNLSSKKPSASKGKKAKGELQKKAQSGRKKDAPNTSKDITRKRRDVMTKEEAVRRIKEAAAKKMEQAGKANWKKETENSIGAKKSRPIKSESKSDSGRALRTRKSARKYVDDDITDTDEETVHQEQGRAGESKSVDTNSASTSKQINSNTEKITVKDTSRDKVSTTCRIALSSGSESDYTAEFKVKKNRKAKSDRKVLSSDSVSEEAPVEDTKKKKDRCDIWSEVFLESEEKWICVDVYHRQIHCVRELYSRASQPVQYVLAWQDDGTIRDVTRRYCPQWHTVTRKHRVDEEWWKESLRPFTGQRTARDKQEDEDLERQLQDRPLPTSLAEYKNHPLYVLKKDLLKFQGIYPPDAPTLGFVRGHPVYARECVHTLHSREIWLKEAKVVRLGETPYKIVKARPKWDRMSGKVIKDLPLELFGPWQVEDYVPPTAVDGKVPRNAYGNVELFKPSMLPGGTVHMRIPGLNRVARKLQIDCAPAVTGFDFHCGSSHPVYDGFVVCEEYKDVLAEAWQAEEEEADRRYEEKRLKRIYGNWRKLIKGLLIRERLKARYDFGPVKEKTKTKVKKAKGLKEPKRRKTVDSDDSDWEMGQCD